MMKTITAHSGSVKTHKKGKSSTLKYFIKWSRINGYLMCFEEGTCYNVDFLYRAAQAVAPSRLKLYPLKEELHTDSLMKEINNFKGALKR